MLSESDFDPQASAATQHTSDEAHDEQHELPRGALLLTITYLLLICLLWADVYLNLLGRGVPAQ
jgi:hypothetical protein